MNGLPVNKETENKRKKTQQLYVIPTRAIPEGPSLPGSTLEMGR
jgi:hypothetical protein